MSNYFNSVYVWEHVSDISLVRKARYQNKECHVGKISINVIINSTEVAIQNKEHHSQCKDIY